MAYHKRIKKKVVSLRKKGGTYAEIQKAVKVPISKGTLSHWCRDIKLPGWYEQKMRVLILDNLARARTYAAATNRTRRVAYMQIIRQRNAALASALYNPDIAKIALALLYITEGSSKTRGVITFGNSSPFIISLFLRLLRNCYTIDEMKFRCTIQCRADQNIGSLELFWSNITLIPLTLFYKARIDPRTIGKPSKKPDYKGVCRINYFSADILLELQEIPKIIHLGP
ncbi:MAG: hypothetical protein HYS45_02220 [Parcubacteria group bacterium]|nr:hypothetical protein [Parcubacteria group bacterium]